MRLLAATFTIITLITTATAIVDPRPPRRHFNESLCKYDGLVSQKTKQCIFACGPSVIANVPQYADEMVEYIKIKSGKHCVRKDIRGKGRPSLICDFEDTDVCFHIVYPPES